MNLGLRVWMPLAVMLTLLLSVALMFLYGIPATESRLDGYTKSFTPAEAATMADDPSEVERSRWQEALDRSVGDASRQTLVVDGRGRVVARAGSEFMNPPPEQAVGQAASHHERLPFGRRLEALLVSAGLVEVP